MRTEQSRSRAGWGHQERAQQGAGLAVNNDPPVRRVIIEPVTEPLNLPPVPVEPPAPVTEPVPAR